MTRNCSPNFLHNARAAGSKSKSSMKRSNINSTSVNTGHNRPMGCWGYGQSIKLAFCVAVAVFGLASPDRAFGRVMVPVEYIKIMEAIQTQEGPANPSPFAPLFDPAPAMWFKPAQAPTWKPYLKTQDEILDYGYIIWQPWATKGHHHELYNPYTLDYYGYRNEYWQWDQTFGYRYTADGWNCIDGDWSEDSGWMWSGFAAFDREKCGNVIGYRDNWNWSGYAADIYETRDAQWKLRNLRQAGQPDFEVAVWYEVIAYPYGHHRQSAYENGEVRDRKSWRIFCLEPGSAKDITPTWIPRNHELTTWPYLGLDMKSYADNNAELPEWVEGTY